MKNDSREKREREEGIRKNLKNISGRFLRVVFVDMYDPIPNLKEGQSYSQKLIRDNKKTFRGWRSGVP